MKKIVIDARMIKHSGIGTYLQNLIPLLCADNKLVLLGDRNILGGFIWADKIEIVHFICPILSIKEQFLLPLIIPWCDIFWSPQYNIPILPIRAKRRWVTIHDVYHLAFGGGLTLLQRIYSRRVINWAVRISDDVVTVSNFSKAEIVKYTRISPEKVKVIYNGVDSSLYKVMTDKNCLAGLKVKYNLPEHFLLFVGNIKPHKNIQRLVKAMKSVNRKYSLVISGKKDGFITGDQELFEIIKNDMAIKDRLIFTGLIEQEDLPCLYSAATLLVFPSLYEGFGLPLLEAMACCCPCVVSKEASMPEVCGGAAYYIDPLNADDIAKGVECVLNSDQLRSELIKKGLVRARMFSWENSASELIKLMDK